LKKPGYYEEHHRNTAVSSSLLSYAAVPIEESMDFQIVGQLVKAGGVNARAQPKWTRLDGEFRGSGPNGFCAKTRPHGGIERFLERLSRAMHRIAQHLLDVLFQCYRRSHCDIMMLLQHAVKDAH